MRFTTKEIALARRLKQLGLPWDPGVGHYVWDESGIIDCESPFHDSVYFILDLRHFLRKAETVENLKRDLCWLPCWLDAREILRQLGVADELVSTRLRESAALETGEERLCLYHLIEEGLKQRPPAQSADSEPVSTGSRV